MSWKLPFSISTCLVVTLLTGCGNEASPQSNDLVKPFFEAEKTLTQQKLISTSVLAFDPQQNFFKLLLVVQHSSKVDAERLVSNLLNDVTSYHQEQSPSTLLKPYNISVDIVSESMKGPLLYHASKAAGSTEMQWT